MSGLRWLEGPFGREAANPWAGQATRGWECTSLSQVASVASRGGRFCVLFFDAHREGRWIAYVTYCPVNQNCHQTAAITSHNRSSLAAS